MRWMAITGAALLLAGCGGGDETPRANATAPAASGRNYQAAVLALNPRQLNGVLLRAVLDVDQPCQGVKEIARQPDADGYLRWATRCEGGADWLVSIAPSGDAKVTGPIGNAVFAPR